METKFFSLTPESDPTQAIHAAAEAIRRGGLVIFPTETVYGIGCNALDVTAVRALYAAKSRPYDKPLLLHLHSLEQAEELAYIDDTARRLLQTFTPGPLSVIVRKKEIVPAQVTSGGESVGLRFPDHPVFLAIARRAGVPIAATSANRSGSASATDGRSAAFTDAADVIIDGGVCAYSVESTIISLTGETPKFLREGAISQERLLEVLEQCV